MPSMWLPFPINMSWELSSGSTMAHYVKIITLGFLCGQNVQELDGGQGLPACGCGG